MKLINDSGGWTKITINEFGWPEYQEAADRLVSREYPGYFASDLNYYNLECRDVKELELHPCRGVGGLTERLDKTVHVRIINSDRKKLQKLNKKNEEKEAVGNKNR